MSDCPVVIKLGGSILAQQTWKPRFHRWLKALGRTRAVVILGGGPRVKALRLSGNLDDETAHWASIAIMRENATQVAAEFPRGHAVSTWEQVEQAWRHGQLPFFDVEPFLRAEDTGANPLPHTWDVSSDSIAARLATRHDADLILLKSCLVLPGPYDWPDLARHGVVDAYFPRVAPAVRNITLANLPGSLP